MNANSMPGALHALGFFVLLFFEMFSTAHAQQAEFIPLGQLPAGRPTNAWDISADGQTVVGETSDTRAERGFRWTRATGMVALSDLPGGREGSGAIGVSANAEYIAGYSWSSRGLEGTVWSANGVPTGMGVFPNATDGGGFAVSQNGRAVAGTWWIPSASSAEGFFWTAETGLMTLGSLPGAPRTYTTVSDMTGDGKIVVGSCNSESGRRPYMWTLEDGMSELPILPGDNSFPAVADITTDGRWAVGRSGGQAAIWDIQAGTVRGLGNLPSGRQFYVSGCSQDGRVVVGESSASEAVIWTESWGARLLSDVLRDQGVDVAEIGWRVWSCMGVSADGSWICGDGWAGNNIRESYVVHLNIPSPTTAMIAAISCCWLLRRQGPAWR